MQVARLKNVDIHWREDGHPDGLPLVFANSLGTDLRLWDQVVAKLPKDQYRIIRFDKRGHGLSSCPKAPYSLSDLAGDTEALLDHLEISECVFVGLSIGGMIGQSLAAISPKRISKLVLACTAVKMGTASMWEDRIAQIKSGGMKSIADSVMERWFSETYLKEAAVIGWSNMLARTPADGYIGCCHALAKADLTQSSRQLETPTLCIAGTADLASPPDLVRATADLIPNSRFIEIEGAGHLPCAEKPEVFASLLQTYLKEGTNAG